MAEAQLAVVLAGLSAGALAWLAVDVLASRLRAQRRLDAAIALSAGAAGPGLRPRERALEAVLRTFDTRHADAALGSTPDLASRLRAAGLAIAPGSFRRLGMIAGAGSAAIGWLVSASPAVALGAGLIIGVLAPRIFIARLIAARRRRFLDGFGGALDMILRGARSGLPVIACLELVAREADEPVRTAFATLLVRYRAGLPLAQALRHLCRDMPLQEVAFFAMVIAVQERAGGSLDAALSNLADVLRDRRRLARRIAVASAEARLSALILGTMPLIVLVLLSLTSPDHIRVMWQEPAGRQLGALGAAWMAAGAAILMRLVRIRV
jgi:tight adherence protein B